MVWCEDRGEVYTISGHRVASRGNFGAFLSAPTNGLTNAPLLTGKYFNTVILYFPGEGGGREVTPGVFRSALTDPGTAVRAVRCSVG